MPHNIRILTDGLVEIRLAPHDADEAHAAFDRTVTEHRADFDPDGPAVAVQLLGDRGQIVAEEVVTSLDKIPTGTRVGLAPHTDDWMRGRRYGTIADDSIVPDAPRQYLLRFDDGEYGWFAEDDLLRPVP